MIDDSSNEIPDGQYILFIDAKTVRKAQQEICSCDSCSPDDAEYLFSSILDSLMGNDPSVSEYVLEIPAKCPHCGTPVTEWTLIKWIGIADQGWSVD